MTLHIAWSVAHGEFTIEDGYYFSLLRRELQQAGVQLSVPTRLQDALAADVLVLNYPEQPFSPDELAWLQAYVEQGGRLVTLAYYQNEDRVAEILNAVLAPFGMRFGYDHVIDPVHHHNQDPYMVVTRRVSGISGVQQVLLPYAAPVMLNNSQIRARIEAEATAESPSGSRVLVAHAARGKGECIAVGTCVFWDNFALGLYDNLALARWLLRLEE